MSALRVSLLVAMGIVPAACGGTMVGHGGEPNGGSGGTAGDGVAGNQPYGGAFVEGGTVGTAGTGIVTAGTGIITAGAGGSVYTTCQSPQFDPTTGLVSCAEGYTHRPVATRCEAPLGVGGYADEGAGGYYDGADLPVRLPRADGSVECGTNPSVCNAFEYGYCNDDFEGGGPPYRTCYSGCVTDADCGVGAVCICDSAGSPTGGSCRAAACQTDDDCGGRLCASYNQACGRGGFACQGPGDQCHQNADCGPGGVCSWAAVAGYAGNHRVCTMAVCGRPFLVQHQARLAPVARSAAWRAPEALEPRTDHLTDAERASLAAHWTKLGQMEHASIAAFARFSLQLLSLGAPPELVEACTRALADETAHTRLCFELASAYAGRALGPGPLDVDGSLAASSLADIVDLVLVEGCFGETGAALDALEAADSAADPVIAAAYAQIAADEQRHAELAFRFLRWALERGGQSVAERITAALSNPPAASAATREVTLPCLRALLTRAGEHRLLPVDNNASWGG